jgi:hypothetical protein
MNITKTLTAVYVLPEFSGHQNVIRRVVWGIQFEDAGYISEAAVDTILPIDTIEQFIPANQVGNEKALQWAYDAQGGDAFLAQLEPFHADQIQFKKALVGVQPYAEGFGIPALVTGLTETPVVGAQNL